MLCDTTSPGEARFKVALEERLRLPFVKVRPEWLINPKTRQLMELDMYVQAYNRGWSPFDRFVPTLVVQAIWSVGRFYESDSA
jgi:hypothetical protein